MIIISFYALSYITSRGSMSRRSNTKGYKMPLSRVYISAKTPHGNFIISTKKQASLNVMPLRRNPHKKILGRASKDARSTAVFYYENRAEYVCISSNGLFVSFHEEDIIGLIKALYKFKECREQRLNDELRLIGARSDTRARLKDGDLE